MYTFIHKYTCVVMVPNLENILELPKIKVLAYQFKGSTFVGLHSYSFVPKIPLLKFILIRSVLFWPYFSAFPGDKRTQQMHWFDSLRKQPALVQTALHFHGVCTLNIKIVFGKVPLSHSLLILNYLAVLRNSSSPHLPGLKLHRCSDERCGPRPLGMTCFLWWGVNDSMCLEVCCPG